MSSANNLDPISDVAIDHQPMAIGYIVSTVRLHSKCREAADYRI